jgi:hypothetical protein
LKSGLKKPGSVTMKISPRFAEPAKDEKEEVKMTKCTTAPVKRVSVDPFAKKEENIEEKKPVVTAKKVSVDPFAKKVDPFAKNTEPALPTGGLRRATRTAAIAKNPFG